MIFRYKFGTLFTENDELNWLKNIRFQKKVYVIAKNDNTFLETIQFLPEISLQVINRLENISASNLR